MKKLLLGVAFLGFTIVSCQNPSKNTVEAGAGPDACPMGGNCEMDREACEDMGACPMGEDCDMDSDCDMGAGDCDTGAGVCPESGETCDMDKEACDEMGACPMGGDCDMDAKAAESDCCSGKE
jgi:hypothetical protein